MERYELEQARRLFRKIGGAKDDWVSRDKTRYLLLEASFAEADGDTAGFERKLVEALESDPLNGEVLMELGSLHSNRGENAKAMFYFERAYDSETYEYDALVLASQMFINDRRFADSLDLLRRASILKPSVELKSLIERVRVASLQ